MLSLAAHSQAVCGGEWHCDLESNCYRQHWLNKTLLPDEVNLTKIFGREPLPLGEWFVINLYREDIEAQLRSWKKASISGKWMEGRNPTSSSELPADALEQIKHAQNCGADYRLSYEQLISNWDEYITTILKRADWPYETILKATIRT
jgi:hypothetical protein